MHIDTGTTMMPVSCNKATDNGFKDYTGSCILLFWYIEIVIDICVKSCFREQRTGRRVWMNWILPLRHTLTTVQQ